MADVKVNREELEAWLKTQPREVSVVIAARAALRVLPLLYGIFEPNRNVESAIVLLIFRATTLPWAASNGPAQGSALLSSKAAAAADAARAAAVYAGSVDAAAYAAYDATVAASADYAARAVAADVAADAADAAAASADAAARADAAAFAAYAAYDAVFSDREHIEAGGSVASLAGTPLWHDQGTPDRIARSWSRLRQTLLARDEGWDVWTDWYDARLQGRRARPNLEVARVTLPENLWEQGPAAVNARIRELIEEYEPPEEPKGEPGQRAEIDPASIDIPPQKAAALEPIWVGAQLALADDPARSGLSSVDAALAALKQDFSDFIEDLEAEEANLDSRLLMYLRRLADRIPTSAPSHDVLFSIAHNETLLKDYGRTVSEEWPDFLSARYHALSMHFGRVMHQFPEWRLFLAEVPAKAVTADDLSAIASTGQVIADSLAAEVEAEQLDRRIPETLSAMSTELEVSLGEVVEPRPVTAYEAELGRDVQESTNNTLKRIFEPILEAAGRLSKRGLEKYSEGALEQFDEEMKAAGKGHTKMAFGFLKLPLKIGVGSSATATAASGLGYLEMLAARFPETYYWLEPVLKFLSWV
ncbi:hypothetical protein [Labrenzia sp. CE80]|uniref:hypothetical protein n=1 Tax=Labrenzia sp. CE80 TaxID=1788986 RepID=UPI00129BE31A|nr:hypothetical protein [Labrenzia sp. CE80]